MPRSVDARPPFPDDFRLFLASASPRRHSLLRDIGVPYEVVRTSAEEITEGDTAVALAAANATAKALRAALPADFVEGAFVLGTDTLVTLHGRVMGKPDSPSAARDMLSALAGKTHEVVSGVALRRIAASGGGDAASDSGSAEPGARECQDGQLHVGTATTAVTFLPLDQAEINVYVTSGEWVDKAGGYAIQGLAGLFVSALRGEYSNVVGLPLCLLARLFRECGFDLLRRQWI